MDMIFIEILQLNCYAVPELPSSRNALHNCTLLKFNKRTTAQTYQYMGLIGNVLGISCAITILCQHIVHFTKQFTPTNSPDLSFTGKFFHYFIFMQKITNTKQMFVLFKSFKSTCLYFYININIIAYMIHVQYYTLADPPLTPRTYDFLMPKTLIFLIFFFARD